MAQDPFLALVRAMPERDLLAALPELNRPQLLRLRDAFAPEDCDCPPVLLPCGCPGCACEDGDPCNCDDGCLPDFAPCCHFKPYYFPMPVLDLLYDLLEYPAECPECEERFARPTGECDCGWRLRPIPDASGVLLPEAMAAVMARRAERGQELWNPQDAIRRGADDRIRREVRRLRNGAAIAGRLVLDQQQGAAA